MKSLSRAFLPSSLLAASLAFHAGLTPAGAALIAEDQFATGGGSNYTAGGALFGQSATTTGMTGSWTGGSSTTAGAEDSNNIGISSTNLTLPGVSSTLGGSVLMTTTNSVASGSINESRTLGATATGSTAWFGFLFNPVTLNLTSNRFQIGLLSGTGTVPADAATDTGAILTGGTTGIEGFALELTGSSLFLRLSNNSTSMPQGSPVGTVAANQTYLALFQLQANTSGVNDTLNFWLLSSAPSSQAGLGSPLFTTSTTNIFSSLSALDTLFLDYAHPGGQATITVGLDAIRLGDAYLDAVPEPSTLGLLLLGGLGALFPLSRLRRRAFAA